MSKDSEQTTQPTKKFDGGNAAQKQDRTRGLLPPWKSGQSGNPAGRPKGSRNKLSEQFLEETYEVWQELTQEKRSAAPSPIETPP